MNRPNTIRHYTDKFLEEGRSGEYLRDIWYYMKGDIEHLKFKDKTEKQWDAHVNEAIGKHIFSLYLAGDYTIYERLNIVSEGLVDDNYIGNTPMVIFAEKKTRTINTMSKALLAPKYYSKGQIPNFECVNIAKYLRENSTGNTVYIVGLTDFDPAGEIILGSLGERVRSIFESWDIGVDLKVINVEYGSSYEEVITNYKTFTLSTNKKNHGCQRWITTGRPLGVEFNNIDDRAFHLDRAVREHIDPTFVRALSEQRVRASIYNDLLDADEEYQKLLIRQKEIEDVHSTTAEEGIADFTPIWGTPISYRTVKAMTTIRSS